MRKKNKKYKQRERRERVRSSRGEAADEEVEIDLRSLETFRVDEVRRDVGRPESSEVLRERREGRGCQRNEGRRRQRESTNLFGQPLHQRLDSDLVDEGLGDSLLEDGLRRLDLLVQDALLEFDLKSVETTRELVTEKRTSDGSLLLEKKKARREGVSESCRKKGRNEEDATGTRTRTHSSNVFRPNGLELEPSILADLGLDILDVSRVEG